MYGWRAVREGVDEVWDLGFGFWLLMRVGGIGWSRAGQGSIGIS